MEMPPQRESRFGAGIVLFLGDVRDAIAGKPHDYTQGRISKAIMVLAVPMILEMLMESIFIIVDIYFVGKLGSDAVAVVGFTEQILSLPYAVALGLSVVAAAMVARRVGEKRHKETNKVAFVAILLGIMVSIPILLVGLFFSDDILRLMGASEAVVALGEHNMMMMLAGNATILLLFIINAIFRGAGNPAIAMRILWISNGINILLDPCLIFGWGPFPELGVLGAAVATNIGRGIGICLQLYYLFKGSAQVALTRADLKPNWVLVRQMVRLSWWGVVQWTVATSSWIVLLRITAIFGSHAIAGYAIAIRVLIIAILPAQGLACAAATLVGQNLGAGFPDRAQRATWQTSWYSMALMALIMVVMLLLNKSLIGFFATDAETLAEGTASLVYMSFALIPYAMGLVVIQAINGAGDTTTPTIINFFCYWVFQIPMAYFLAVTLGMESKGVYLTIALAQALLAPIGVLFFRRGHWKTKVV